MEKKIEKIRKVNLICIPIGAALLILSAVLFLSMVWHVGAGAAIAGIVCLFAGVYALVFRALFVKKLMTEIETVDLKTDGGEKKENASSSEQEESQ